MRHNYLTFLIAFLFVGIPGFSQEIDFSELDSMEIISDDTFNTDSESGLDVSDLDTEEDEDESDPEEEEKTVKVSFNGYFKAMNYWSRSKYSDTLMDVYRSNNETYGENTNPSEKEDDGYRVSGIRIQLQLESYLSDRARFYSAINLDFNEAENGNSVSDTETIENAKESRGSGLRLVESYVEIYEGDRTWKAGAQLMTWGFVDGYETPTDRLNARDFQYSSTEYEDTKLASTGLLMTQSFGDSFLDLIYIPKGKPSKKSYSEENLFVGGKEEPDNATAKTKYAARYYGNLGKFDYALSHIIGTDTDSDVSFVKKSNAYGGTSLAPQQVYHRIKSIALDFQYNFTDWIFQGGYLAYETSDEFEDSKEIEKLQAGEEAEFAKNDWREYIIGGEFLIKGVTLNLYTGQRFIDDWDEDDLKNRFTGQNSRRLDYVSAYLKGDYLSGNALNVSFYTSQFWDDEGAKVSSRNKLTLTYKLEDGLEVLFGGTYDDFKVSKTEQLQTEVKYSF